MKPKHLFLCLLTAFGLSLAQLPAEESIAMPPDTPFDPHPEADGSPTRKILTYGTDADGNAVPLKTLRITNNAAQTIYPIMRAANTGLLKSNPGVGLYNPYDPPNKEYRGYIGYTGDDGKYYFGLQPGQSIVVPLPLALWNAARIAVGTDGEFIIPSEGYPNPLSYDPKALRSITASLPGKDSITNGVVMWYRAETPLGPNDDVLDQLAEWTIRDYSYLSNPAITRRTHGEITDDQLVTLINYDVSNVDTLYLPMAMAALDSWIMPNLSGTGPHPNRDGYKPGSDPAPLGWTGAINDIEFIKGKIKEFTAQKPNKLLGQYFGGEGWPYYNSPLGTDPDHPRKIPSGANIFAQSPLLATPSSYLVATDWLSNRYMLTSGGTDAILVNIGVAGNPVEKGSTTLYLAPDTPAAKMDFIKPGYGLASHLSEGKPQFLAPGTTVKSVNAADFSVELTKPLLASPVGSNVDFIRPTHDYAAEAMIRLWFSWAEYYLMHWKDKNPAAPTAPVQIKGSIEARSAHLRFNEARPELVEGMAVSGPGLDDAQTETGPHLGKAIILQISGDKKTAILSQVTTKASQDAPFTFEPPQQLFWTPKKAGDPGYPLFGDKLRFDKVDPSRDPLEFSRSVYLVMASMNQINKADNNTLCKFMQDNIGGNMGFIFDQPGKDSADGKMVQAKIRDHIKSILRGVSDFTNYPDLLDAKGNHTVWYPDPATPTGGQPFNVFNLDPYVWFVHVRLRFSGYGFSVDDDVSDIGANGANHLQLSVAGPGGLVNTHPWANQAPWGPVKNFSATYSGPDHGDNAPSLIKNVSNTTPIVVTTVDPHNMKRGDKVSIDSVCGTTAANGTFQIGDYTTTTFALLDEKTGEPVAGNGAYTPTPTPGNWGLPKKPYIDTGADLSKVFYRVKGNDPLGTFQGAVVTVENLPLKSGQKVRVAQLGKTDTGRLILTDKIVEAGGTDLPAGTYNFTFSAD